MFARLTGLVCGPFAGVSVLSCGVQLFDKVGGKQPRLAVEVAVPPALLHLHRGPFKLSFPNIKIEKINMSWPLRPRGNQVIRGFQVQWDMCYNVVETL